MSEEKKKKKLQSSVIVPRNGIDSHPAEHEIALADDTAVTQWKTHCDSNVNNLQQALTHNQWTERTGSFGGSGSILAGLTGPLIDRYFEFQEKIESKALFILLCWG